MIVFAFDRDHTVSTSPHPEREVVPIEWVRRLAAETDHEVWATGNQALKREADIPGLQELVRRLDGEWYDRLGDRVDDEYHEEYPGRAERLRLLEERFPDADRYVVVDDVDLSDVEGWDHYFAWDFVAAIRAGDFALGIDLGD